MNAKNILIIAPKVFGILDPLQHLLVSKGWEVNVIDDRFSKNFFNSLILRYFRSIYFFFNRKSIFSLAKPELSSFSLILIINGEALSLKMHQELIESGLDVRFYSWDSTKNKRYLKGVFDLYKSKNRQVFTFDIEDSNRHAISYRPLFCEKIIHSDQSKEYTLSFVGTMHSSRLKYAVLAKKLVNDGDNSFIRLFCKNKCIYVFQLVRNIFLLHSFLRLVRVGSISSLEFQKIMTSSDLVVDFCHPNQSGLTHRSVLAIRNGIRVLSNNKHIPNSIKIDIDNQTFYDSCGLKNEQYSVEEWANEVLGDLF